MNPSEFVGETFEGAIELEAADGRHLISQQLAAWIPAEVAHLASLHRTPSVSIFFTRGMIAAPGDRMAMQKRHLQALAKECGACFINLKASTVLSKWYGDTNKLIHAVWTLAYKLQPCILFIGKGYNQHG